MPTRNSIGSRSIDWQAAISSSLIGREAFERSVSPRQKRSKPPPVPEMPTVTRAPLFFFWNVSAAAIAYGPTVLEPSAVIVPLVARWKRGFCGGDNTLRSRCERLADFEVPQTLTHGCLCRRHVIAAGAVGGVDDWGLGSPAGDPLRDLGRFAVSVADARLPEVLAGRTSFATGIRHFVTSTLGRTPVPRKLWREVLLLTQLELAFEALERGDPHGMARLSRSVRALQVPTRTR